MYAAANAVVNKLGSKLKADDSDSARITVISTGS
jgi:hypothetical protein